MVARKAYRGKRRTRRRVAKPTMRVARPLRSSKVMRMAKVCYASSWAFSTASTSGFWQYKVFTPNNSVQNWTEINQLFDEYKVNAIKVTFRPRYDSITGADNGAGTVQAYAHYVIDPASTTTPSGTYGAVSLNSFLEQSGVKTRTLNRPFSVYFRPKV